MILSTPRSEQGQAVERSYGWSDGEYYRRTVDKSEQSTKWSRAADSSQVPESYDAGGANAAPPVTEWVSCAAPE